MTKKYVSLDEDIKTIAENLARESKHKLIVDVYHYDDIDTSAGSITYRRADSIPQMQKLNLVKVIKQTQSILPRQKYKFDTALNVYPVYQIKILLDNIKKFLNQKLLNPTQLIKKVPPQKWQLIEEGYQVQLQKNRQTVFTFPHNWADKCRYFQCLWNHYDQFVPYKTIYEYDQKSIYPEKEIAKKNTAIRNVFYKLRTELKKLPIEIKINKGAKLTFLD